MQQHKRGNPRKSPRKRHIHTPPVTISKPPEVARVTLHETDPITGNEESLSTLFYEYYRGYTIYSTEQGRCCIHGKQGCVRLRDRFVSFPDIEDAKTLIKQFRVEGYTSYDSSERYLPEGEFVCLNKREQHRRPALSRPMQRVS